MKATTHDKPVPDWSTLTFSFTETDYIYRADGDTRREPVWAPGRMEPYGPIALVPAAAVLSYGAGIFEGLKAFRRDDGTVQVFRPDANAARFQRSAERLSMAPFPIDEFLSGVDRLVDANRRFVPPPGLGSFYIRPMQHGIEPRLGYGACRELVVTMYGSPVGAVGSSTGAIRLKAVERARVAPGGTGAAKAMGNYAGSVHVAGAAKQEGFDDVLYLDARELKYATETSGANLFVVNHAGQVITPPLDDQILAGVTRDSALTVAQEVLGLDVQERRISIDEILADAREAFCTGTAWTIRSVGEIAFRDRSVRLPGRDLRDRLWEIISGIQTGRLADGRNWTRLVPEGVSGL
ncbi:MAG: branched-chain-amino-acid transaminase [Acidobacteriota bacterium]